MFGEIQIAVEDAYPARFHLREEGAPPRVAAVAVVDIQSEEVIWWLVPASFSTVQVPFTTDVTPEDVEALADAEPYDPIEDLPPSDSRHQAAIERRDSINEAAFPVLDSLTIGVVPSGFRQATPGTGVAALVRGRAYALTVMGPGGHGQIEFRG